MSGAVSGHQSARQRQAEQIISRDVEEKERERVRENGEGKEERQCRDTVEGRPQHCVFNICLTRITETGLCGARSRKQTARTTLSPSGLPSAPLLPKHLPISPQRSCNLPHFWMLMLLKQFSNHLA